MYANPLYYEMSSGTSKMEAYLTDDLGLSKEEARETVAEMVYICRTDSCPTFLIDALNRRGHPVEKEHELDLILKAIDLEAGIRQWERLGVTGREMANR